jgi:hypothetical protein
LSSFCRTALGEQFGRSTNDPFPFFGLVLFTPPQFGLLAGDDP